MENVILLVCLAGVIFITLYFMLKRVVVRWFQKTSQLENIKTEMERMLVELNHATSRNIDLIEERVARLKDLLAVIDKRLLLYKREIEKSEKGKQVYSSLMRQRTTENEQKPAVEDAVSPGVQDKVLTLHRSGFTPAMIAHRLKATIGEVELIIALAENETRRVPPAD